MATQNSHSMQNPQSGVFGAIFTVILYVVSLATLQSWAAIATVFSGCAVGALALYRLYKEVKKRRMR